MTEQCAAFTQNIELDRAEIGQILAVTLFMGTVTCTDVPRDRVRVNSKKNELHPLSEIRVWPKKPSTRGQRLASLEATAFDPLGIATCRGLFARA